MAANIQHASQSWVDFNAWKKQDLAAHRDELSLAYQQVRQASLDLTAGLNAEDMNLQSMPEASPPKWHLAHTSWFFETFLLTEHQPGYRSPHPEYGYLFNSYYNGVGKQYPRARRGLLSRPDIESVLAYRRHVDKAMLDWLRGLTEKAFQSMAEWVILGLNHEQQHQELLLTDIQHGFSFSPLAPAIARPSAPQPDPGELQWQTFPAGIVQSGQYQDDSRRGFAFDNEMPRHQYLLQAYQLASRPVTNAEYLEFLTADGYRQAQYWHSDAWAWLQQQSIAAPLYWRETNDGSWRQHSLAGVIPLDPHAPVCHISWYEACAYANWRACRLPTEVEWEHAAASLTSDAGQFADDRYWQPRLPGTAGNDAQSGLQAMFGSVWEWTSSAYGPYPGFRQPAGAVGEYNGKFMANQYVLRGGSCATPRGHVRASYRNFFYPRDRWQFSGIRLARDCA